MRRSQVRLENNYRVKKAISFISILFLNFEIACSGQNISLNVSTNPVFSENDTFTNPSGNKVVTKYDYYLISGKGDYQKGLKLFMDSVSNKISKFNSFGYANYLLVFYKEDSLLNQASILKEDPRYRYSMFNIYKDDNYIASYYYRQSKFINMNWGLKFGK